MILPYDFDFLHVFAVVWIFIMWVLYAPILSFFGHGTLNAQLHVVRLKWMRMLLHSRRENRVFDGILLGHISASMSFFGSATLIVLAGLVGTLASINHVHASLTQMAFFPPVSLGVFTLNFAALTLVMAICFYSFTYAIRKLAYTLAMIGGLDEAPADTPQAKTMIGQTATVLTESLKSLNNGIRGYYFAIASIFLFFGPYISIATTLAVSLLLFYRQGLSTEALAIERYVQAMNELSEKQS
jgi:uncharacterized membrane protein